MLNRDVFLADSYQNLCYSTFWAPFLCCSFINLCRFSYDPEDSVTSAVAWETSFIFPSSSSAPNWTSHCIWHKWFVGDKFHIYFWRLVKHLIPFLVLERNKKKIWGLTGTPYVRRFCYKWKAKSWTRIMQKATWNSALLVPFHFLLKMLRPV